MVASFALSQFLNKKQLEVPKIILSFAFKTTGFVLLSGKPFIKIRVAAESLNGFKIVYLASVSKTACLGSIPTPPRTRVGFYEGSPVRLPTVADVIFDRSKKILRSNIPSSFRFNSWGLPEFLASFSAAALSYSAFCAALASFSLSS